MSLNPLIISNKLSYIGLLQVDSRELHCHRVVVGGLSRTVFDELAQKSNEMESNGIQRIVIDPAWGLVSDAVEVIVDFMYTSK